MLATYCKNPILCFNKFIKIKFLLKVLFYQKLSFIP